MSKGPTWREQAAVLKAIAEGARPEDQDREIMQWIIASSLLTSEDQMKPCPTCGHPRHDFRWWRVSSAGRLLIAALEEQSA